MRSFVHLTIVGTNKTGTGKQSSSLSLTYTCGPSDVRSAAGITRAVGPSIDWARCIHPSDTTLFSLTQPTTHSTGLPQKRSSTSAATAPRARALFLPRSNVPPWHLTPHRRHVRQKVVMMLARLALPA